MAWPANQALRREMVRTVKIARETGSTHNCRVVASLWRRSVKGKVVGGGGAIA